MLSTSRPMIADLGVLGGLDLEERGADQLGQPAGDLGFADAGGADHDDVLGRDVLAQFGRQLLPAPAIADGDGHGPLGGVLADDVTIQLLHDLPRRQISHGQPPSISYQPSAISHQQNSAKRIIRTILVNMDL